jgi:hypothetical protein
MPFSVVDDRSGVAYQEYRCVYGEDVAAALRFLFNAMAPKDEAGLVLQGIPAMLYLDNGPVAKSGTFRRVMAQLGVDVRTHMPRGSDGRRVTARSKGKVERPFRTVKEAHETLYHFHTPQNEAEANLWLRNYLVRYNAQPHRSEAHARAEDWAARLPEAGLRAMCAWDRFRTFARDEEAAIRAINGLTNPLIFNCPRYSRDSTPPRRCSSRSLVGAAGWRIRIGGRCNWRMSARSWARCMATTCTPSGSIRWLVPPSVSCNPRRWRSR